ncbi:hypothetical protein DICVIV_07946 [Dictyocaulus viviparus]|uniref:RING-type domain-containing protein n=1 Tax=Dictyocaulus viviparus TaxID=29172 RepID=A0A0D8XMX2_DICVI|nr:hypothetical protein DICVIV_07946 [Dictyocaulus viviparus]
MNPIVDVIALYPTYAIEQPPIAVHLHSNQSTRTHHHLCTRKPADMVEQAPQSLHSQLKLAKDMGYSEDVIIAALESQTKDKEGIYEPFDSTNAMLDILNQASLRKSTNTSLPSNSVGNNIIRLAVLILSPYKSGRNSSKNVPRSLSFHGSSPMFSSSRGDELSRLLRTFEAEKIRDLEAAQSDMVLLKARINDLERINNQYQQNEHELRDCIHELQRRNELLQQLNFEIEKFECDNSTKVLYVFWKTNLYRDSTYAVGNSIASKVKNAQRIRVHEVNDFEKCENERIQLSQTIVELQAVTDRLTIENLRNEHQAKDQKELAEHRKKQHDQQIAAMEDVSSIRTLTEKCNALSIDLKDKEKELREKSRRIQEIEDRNSQLREECIKQPETLLEKIMNEYQLRRIEEEKRKETNELFNKKISKYHEQLHNKITHLSESFALVKLASFPRLEEQRRRLEVEKERAVEESEQLRREISRLREKTCAECCICLATKPSVLFLPCRHMVVCDSCHAESTISECPTCRTRNAAITGTILFCVSLSNKNFFTSSLTLGGIILTHRYFTKCLHVG